MFDSADDQYACRGLPRFVVSGEFRRKMMSEQKFEQTEWEVVDGAAQQAPPRASRAATMRALLGPWWRWKIAGLVTAGCIVLALVAALASVLFVVGVAILLLSLVVAKVRQMLRRHAGSVTPR
jgi:uncharacterized membrane protein YtjA (UPF0391 family)